MLENKVPKIATLLVIATTIPQFYYLYNVLIEDFESPLFYESMKKGIDWVNFANIFFTSVYFGLEAIKFFDRRNRGSKMRAQSNYFFILIPVAACLLSLSFIENIDKLSILPAAGADLALMAIETKSTIEGLMPYWLFNIKYRVHIFTIINLAFYYYAMKNFKIDIERNPEKYTNL